MYRFFLMYLINKDETEHTGQVCDNSGSQYLVLFKTRCALICCLWPISKEQKEKQDCYRLTSVGLLMQHIKWVEMLHKVQLCRRKKQRVGFLWLLILTCYCRAPENQLFFILILVYFFLWHKFSRRKRKIALLVPWSCRGPHSAAWRERVTKTITETLLISIALMNELSGVWAVRVPHVLDLWAESYWYSHCGRGEYGIIYINYYFSGKIKKWANKSLIDLWH